MRLQQLASAPSSYPHVRGPDTSWQTRASERTIFLLVISHAESGAQHRGSRREHTGTHTHARTHTQTPTAAAAMPAVCAAMPVPFLAFRNPSVPQEARARGW